MVVLKSQTPPKLLGKCEYRDPKDLINIAALLNESMLQGSTILILAPIFLKSHGFRPESYSNP